MKKEKLLLKIEEAEKEAYYRSLHCDKCLDERRKQRIIDEKSYNKKAMTNVIRRLVCQYCKHEDFFVVDGDLEVCRHSGEIREVVSTEEDYGNHSVRHK